jgi:hypothetical protein
MKADIQIPDVGYEHLGELRCTELQFAMFGMLSAEVRVSDRLWVPLCKALRLQVGNRRSVTLVSFISADETLTSYRAVAAAVGNILDDRNNPFTLRIASFAFLISSSGSEERPNPGPL